MKLFKTRIASLSLLLVLSSCVLAGCKTKGIENPKGAPEFVEKTFIDFTKGEPNENVFVPSHNTTNGGCFGCIWSKNNITYDKDGMHMGITYDSENDLFYGGEFRTATPDGQFNRGFFSAEIKVAKTVGVATTFFLYTGEYEGNPHDEIDIEFLGKDTTKVQFNYYGGNDEGHEFMYDLGFDASLEYHKYGFYWDYDQIVWYVDNVPVYKAVENIPFHDMRMYTNFWKGTDENGANITGWMGELKKSDCPTFCSYKKIYYANTKGQGVNVPPGKGNDSDLIEANKISLYKNGFESKENIAITKNGNYYDVAFSQAKQAFRHLDPLNFAFLEFGDATFSKVKIKNLDSVSYPMFFMYVDSASANDSEGFAITGGSVKSDKGNSSFVKTHSTSIEFVLGAGDTCEFRLELTPGVSAFSKIQIIPDAKTEEDTVLRNFELQDWFIYDNEPTSEGGESTYTKVDLTKNGFDGSYESEKDGDVYQVNFHQNQGGFSYLAPKNISEIAVSNPKFVTIKMVNTSSINYSLAVELSNDGENGLTGGGVISTEKGTSKYDKHGSTSEQFTIGANDTVELKMLMKSSFTSFTKIQMICAFNNQVPGGVDGSFTLIEWTISE